jgi:hypothetical protein
MTKEAATALFLCTRMDLLVVKKLSNILSEVINIVSSII